MAKERQKPGCVTAGGGLAFSFGGAFPEALLRRVATMVQGQSSAWVKTRREAPGATCGSPWQRWAGALQGCKVACKRACNCAFQGPFLGAYV